MILGKLRENAYIRKNVRIEPAEIHHKLQHIRDVSSLLAICPTPTKCIWLGISRATHSLFPETTFDIPQYFSRTVYSDDELKEIAGMIINLKFEKVVFSGFCEYFELLIETMKSLSKDIFIALIYHGSLSELAADQEAKSKFTKSIQLAKEKKFDRIAFIKKGLDTCINKIFKLNAAHVIIPPPDVSGICRERAIMRKSIHIGVFANNQLRKNVHNQIAAALMIDNTLVHTTSKNEYVYFDAGDRIIEHPTYMPWDSFMFLLSQMDINLYNTYTETWGQIFIESLALGVPCLTNNSSGVLDFDDELREKLLVPEHDNPTAFAKKIEQALAEKEQIISLSARYISLLAKISREKLNDFLN